MINANLVSLGNGRPARKPKPYPRPGKKSKDEERHFGSGALPVDELHQWIEKKRDEYARSSTGHNYRNSGT